MNKKSFLRGFGIGVLFAAIILGTSFSIRTSESATITRAKKLGMVFESNNKRAIAQKTEAPEETGQPGASGSPAVTETPGSTDKPAASKTPAASETPGTSGTPAATKEPDAKATKKPASSKKPSGNDISKKFEDEKKNLKKDIEDEKKKLTINDGDWAGKVSKKLEDMGIIDDAVAFDKYLVDNGYSGVINSGTYDVSPDDTYHDIAEKITSRFK